MGAFVDFCPSKQRRVVALPPPQETGAIKFGAVYVSLATDEEVRGVRFAIGSPGDFQEDTNLTVPGGRSIVWKARPNDRLAVVHNMGERDISILVEYESPVAEKTVGVSTTGMSLAGVIGLIGAFILALLLVTAALLLAFGMYQSIGRIVDSVFEPAAKGAAQLSGDPYPVVMGGVMALAQTPDETPTDGVTPSPPEPTGSPGTTDEGATTPTPNPTNRNDVATTYIVGGWVTIVVVLVLGSLTWSAGLRAATGATAAPPAKAEPAAGNATGIPAPGDGDSESESAAKTTPSTPLGDMLDRRPSETITAAVGLTAVIAGLAGFDPSSVETSALAGSIALLPALISFIRDPKGGFKATSSAET
jgi:hypothetical protein